MITNWPEGKDFGMAPEEEVARAEEALPYTELPDNEKQYALFTDGFCCIVGNTEDGRLLCRAPQDGSQKPLKKKVNQASL